MSSEPVYVVVAMDFSDEILDELRALSPRLRVERQFPRVPDKAWASAEVLYTGSRLPENREQAPRLRWIQLHFAGANHLLSEPILQEPDIMVTTASGVHATQIAEFCLTMMLAFTYKLPTILQQQARAEWQTKTSDLLNPRDLFSPRELRGQTLGIVGYGTIGRELARIADALGMRVLAVKRDLMHLADDEGYAAPDTGDPSGEIPDRFYPPEATASMARDSDFLVVTLPMTEGTRHLVNEAVIGAMKPNAVLINVGRGGTVDESALLNALQNRKIAGAALDVFEQEPLPPTSPLWKLDNLIISPHIAGASVNYHRKAAALFMDNLERYLDGKPLLNRLHLERGY